LWQAVVRTAAKAGWLLLGRASQWEITQKGAMGWGLEQRLLL